MSDSEERSDRRTAGEWLRAYWGPLAGVGGGLALFAVIVLQNQTGLGYLKTSLTTGFERLDQNMIMHRQEVADDTKALVAAMGDRFRAADHEVHMTQEYRPLRSEVSDLRERVTRLEPRAGDSGG